jgi:hypothetical protein
MKIKYYKIFKQLGLLPKINVSVICPQFKKYNQTLLSKLTKKMQPFKIKYLIFKLKMKD